MASPRYGLPYIWVTQLTGLLAGEKFCRWASWFRAHMTYAKFGNDFDGAAWREVHSKAVGDYVKSLRKDGWTTQVESQNAFKVTGRTAVVSGKPDIVAYRDNDVVVGDCKTGQRKDEHLWQMYIYMHLLPKAWPELLTRNLSAVLRYADGDVAIPYSDLTRERKQAINDIVTEVAFDMPPEKTPSPSECKYCNIGPDDCPERAQSEERTGTTTEF